MPSSKSAAERGGAMNPLEDSGPEESSRHLGRREAFVTPDAAPESYPH